MALEQARLLYTRELECERVSTRELEDQLKECQQLVAKLQQASAKSVATAADIDAIVHHLNALSSGTYHSHHDGSIPPAVYDAIILLQQTLDNAAEKVKLAELGSHNQSEMIKSSYEELVVGLNKEIEEKDMALKSLHEELDVCQVERSNLRSEYSVLLNKVKTTLAPKLQDEMEQAAQLRSQVEALNQTVSTLQDERSLLKSEIASLIAGQATILDQNGDSDKLRLEVDSLSAELMATRADLEKSHRRLAALQQHLSESEEAATHEALQAEALTQEFKTRAEALEREREAWETMALEAREATNLAEHRANEARVEAEAAREESARLAGLRDQDLISQVFHIIF